jgi:hypothetical protein
MKKFITRTFREVWFRVGGTILAVIPGIPFLMICALFDRHNGLSYYFFGWFKTVYTVWTDKIDHEMEEKNENSCK